MKRFQPDDVKLLCSVYFGTTQLSTQVSSKPASCPRGARLAQNGDTTYKIYFLSKYYISTLLDNQHVNEVTIKAVTISN